VRISRSQVFKRTKGRCGYCSCKLAKGWQRDHIVPLIRFKNVRYSFSGSTGCKYPQNHNLANIVPACRACNKAKSNLDIETYRGSLRWPGWRSGIVFYFEKQGAA
jgi:5-methylcytosine-specific restriction endonuclease McrA